ncbi:restriction endonuclease subunit S [Acholeplasma laidlawii]|uniref:Type I restriction enzyme, S subunit n=1 Tax=Acholeplasma laidlawii (strain PG-8A) TaxID=441768 RepID=A9NHP0_ACHLI|nr:restriction endonuclease subunit S [Acholeplasma laidlawii]ABX81870.1 type I restriction enzyme, S subunit [Acholeplasma laidlawii PG-8A]RED19313.1 type I restriction enzyme S subunit [Acholeplasma laidlawii]SQH57461.1 EcoKI restriction-modification system protein HsdS [Acholeplasma laidlawii]
MNDVNYIYGVVPDNWKKMKIKHFYELYSGGTPLSSVDSNYAEEGVCFVNISDMTNTEYITDTTKKLTDKGIKNKNLKILKSGTILYSIYASLGSVSELKTKATISQAILALIPKMGISIDKNYLKFLLMIAKENIFYFSNGTTQSNLNADIVNNLPLIIPELNNQIRISLYVGNKTLIINKLIDNQKQQIEKLKEYKQSLISEVVTKGLNPNVEFKDSNVKWIGLIPKNYDVSLISRHTFVTKLAGFEFTEILSKNINEFDDIPIVRAQNIKNDKFIKDFTGYINNDTARKLVRSNLDKPCILMTFIGAGVGEVAIFNEEKLHQLAPNVAKIEILKSHEDRISLRYLLYYLMSNAANFEKDQYLKATAQPNISMTIIRGLRFVLPPIDDQNKIIKYLDNKVLRLDELIELKNKKIDELYNYKKSLIYEYVTGKKEVS